jgi:hypothetical protein
VSSAVAAVIVRFLAELRSGEYANSLVSSATAGHLLLREPDFPPAADETGSSE